MLTISSINPKNKHLFKIVITLKQSKKKTIYKVYFSTNSILIDEIEKNK